MDTNLKNKKSLGIMLDCSRNAVMRPEEVKKFVKLIAGMGYNMLQLYTEDTYEIEGEPFFGHMRGRYTQEELRDIDDYCADLGVELIPCIQTLAHLMQLKQWKAYEPLFDCNDVLMAGDERVYALIEKMFDTITKCFRSRRVNIGMDEAFFIGRGRYQDVHGYRNRMDILIEHLKRVKEIADRHGFHIMMWSDMFIRPHNNGMYYGEGIQIPQETIDKVPEDVELVYWDYCHRDKENYEDAFQTHHSFPNQLSFAGGFWTWTGLVPNIRFTWHCTETAIRSVNEHDFDTVFFTMWGDGGKECSFYSQLPHLFATAKMINGTFDKEAIMQEFKETYGYDYQEFLNLDMLNLHGDGKPNFLNAAKFLLYNDPFLGLFDFTVSEEVSEKYKEAAKLVAQSVNGRPYDYLFNSMAKLGKALELKADLGVRIRAAYQSGDKEMLRKIAEVDFPATEQALEEFYEAFRSMWLRENKTFGLEVHEQRFGGLLYRMKTCKKRLLEYLDGKAERIEELEEERLPKCDGWREEEIHWNSWSRIVTTCVI